MVLVKVPQSSRGFFFSVLKYFLKHLNPDFLPRPFASFSASRSTKCFSNLFTNFKIVNKKSEFSPFSSSHFIFFPAVPPMYCISLFSSLIISLRNYSTALLHLFLKPRALPPVFGSSHRKVNRREPSELQYPSLPYFRDRSCPASVKLFHRKILRKLSSRDCFFGASSHPRRSKVLTSPDVHFIKFVRK